MPAKLPSPAAAGPARSFDKTISRLHRSRSALHLNFELQAIRDLPLMASHYLDNHPVKQSDTNAKHIIIVMVGCR